MKAVILAGGRGTRLQPLTFAIPKPLIPVGEKPILEIIVSHLKSYGFKEFIFSVGYRAELIETYFKDGSNFGVKIDYFKEDKPLGTAGSLPCIHEVFPFKKGESFLLMNGDILTKLDIVKFIEYHQKGNFMMTVGIKKYEQQLPFGTLKTSKGRILGIQEKPVKKYDINAGIYVINQPALKEIPYKEFFTIPELIKRLLSQNKTVGGYFIEKYWFVVENLKQLEKAHSEMEEWEKD